MSADPSYRSFRISPRRIQAWRGVNELSDRELMRDDRWFGLTPRHTRSPGGRVPRPALP